MDPASCDMDGVEKWMGNGRMWRSEGLAWVGSFLLIRPATAQVKEKAELLRPTVIGVILTTWFSESSKAAKAAVASPRRRRGSP